MPREMEGKTATNSGRNRLSKRRIALAVLALVLLLAAKAWWDTTAEPRVRRAVITLAGLPQGSDPIRVALMSDIHIAGPDMSPGRLAKIVEQVNGLQPDLVLIAGDFVSDKRTATRIYSTAQAIAPLAGLKPRLASVAVPGNHDHWRNFEEVIRELTRRDVVVLSLFTDPPGSCTVHPLAERHRTGKGSPSDVDIACTRPSRRGGGQRLV